MHHEVNISITEATFIAAYEAHWKELYLAAGRYVSDKELAKELVQELFISIWEKRDTLVIHTSVRNYLFGALKLKTLEYYRKQVVRERYIADQQKIQTQEKQVTEEQVIADDLRRKLQEVILQMPKRSQEVYKLSREEGMDNKSIAKVLLISEKAVEGNMTRALSFIRKQLKWLLEGQP